MTNFNKYQSILDSMQEKYNLNYDKRLTVCSIGLAGEVGEMLELIKKNIRDDTPINKSNLTKELGDVLAYVALLGSLYYISLEEIALTNLEKLTSRAERNVLSGSGNDR